MNPSMVVVPGRTVGWSMFSTRICRAQPDCSSGIPGNESGEDLASAAIGGFALIGAPCPLPDKPVQPGQGRVSL